MDDRINELYENLSPVTKNKAWDLFLTSEEAEYLTQLLIENSNALLEDALLLYDAKRYPRALALSVLAIEEVGKIHVLRKMITVDEDSTEAKSRIKKLWKEWRSHKVKNFMWTMPTLLQLDAKVKDLNRFFDPKGNAATFIDELKMASFYVEILDSRVMGTPLQIDPELVDYIVNHAIAVVEFDQVVKTKEAFELYRQHFKGGLDTYSIEHMFRFYEIAEEKGYIEKGRAAKIREFGNSTLSNQ